MNCILCNSTAISVAPAYKDGQSYGHCSECDLRFLDPSKRLIGADEKSRYLNHQTTLVDEGYKKFVEPLMDRVGEIVPPGSHGLDYGAGHQPVLAEHLRTRGYTMSIYDPWFWPDAAVLEPAYDFVVACEVVEHFYHPAREFERLRHLVRPGGILVLNTEIYRDTVDFESWYYRRDPTHVAFYSESTMAWLARRFGFSNEVWIRGRVASLR